MRKLTSRIIVFLVLPAVGTGFSGCCRLGKYCKDQIIIINQPQSRTVREGSNVTFSVLAVKGPPYSTNGLSYQWQFNGIQLSGNLHWTNLAGLGATNSSFTISNVQLANVGFYRVLVSGSPTETSQPASLQMVTGTRSPITVYGTPIGQGGTLGTCPGAYKGKVLYTNDPPYVGWAVEVRTQNAEARNGGSHQYTRVEYLGVLGDPGCAATYITIPKQPPLPAPSTRYQFTIYFKQNPVPTGPYPITLTNFIP